MLADKHLVIFPGPLSLNFSALCPVKFRKDHKKMSNLFCSNEEISSHAVKFTTSVLRCHTQWWVQFMATTTFSEVGGRHKAPLCARLRNGEDFQLVKIICVPTMWDVHHSWSALFFCVSVFGIQGVKMRWNFESYQLQRNGVLINVFPKIQASFL